MELIEQIRARCIEVNPEILVETYCGAPCRCLQAEKEHRNIRLADVLLAAPIGTKVYLASSLVNIDVENPDVAWNLRADTLEEQSEETIAFIARVLGITS